MGVKSVDSSSVTAGLSFPVNFPDELSLMICEKLSIAVLADFARTCSRGRAIVATVLEKRAVKFGNRKVGGMPPNHYLKAQFETIRQLFGKQIYPEKFLDKMANRSLKKETVHKILNNHCLYADRHQIFRHYLTSLLKQLPVDPNLQNEEGKAPLHWAALSGEESLMARLLERGANPNIADKTGRTPLSIAISNVVMTALLRKHHASLNYVINSEGHTSLHHCVKQGDERTLNGLLELGADKNIQDGRGETPLFWAVRIGKKGCVKSLLKSQADPNLPKQEGVTPLMMADEEEIALDLIHYGAFLNARASNGETALHAAAKSGHLKILMVLLRAGANFDIQDHSGRTPLYMALFCGHQECAEALLEYGANPNLSDDAGLTPLMVTLFSSMTTLLIQRGAHVNAKTPLGTSALHYAALTSSLEKIKILLNYRAKINMQNDEGETPLFWAAKDGAIQASELLLEKGADPTIPNFEGQTPLMKAVPYPESVKLLLSRGVRPNTQDHCGNTALHYASDANHIRSATLLLEGGADPEQMNDENKTALPFWMEGVILLNDLFSF